MTHSYLCFKRPHFQIELTDLVYLLENPYFFLIFLRATDYLYWFCSSTNFRGGSSKAFKEMGQVSGTMNVQIMSNNPAPTLCVSRGGITWHTYLIVFRVNPVSLTFCCFLKMFRKLRVRHAHLVCLLTRTPGVSPYHIFFLLLVSCFSTTFLKKKISYTTWLL